MNATIETVRGSVPPVFYWLCGVLATCLILTSCGQASQNCHSAGDCDRGVSDPGGVSSPGTNRHRREDALPPAFPTATSRRIASTGGAGAAIARQPGQESGLDSADLAGTGGRERPGPEDDSSPPEHTGCDPDVGCGPTPDCNDCPDHGLVALSVTPGQLNPGFAPHIADYLVEVPFSTTSVELRAAASTADALVEVDSVPVPASGSLVLALPNADPLRVTLMVTSVDGATSSTRLTIVRSALASFGLRAPALDENARFGQALALDGELLAVGSPLDDSGSRDIVTHLDDVLRAGTDATSPDSGAVYLFRRLQPGNWALEAYLKAPNGAAGDQFGSSLAMSDDILVVGAPFADVASQGSPGEAQVERDEPNGAARDAGAVHVFRRANDGSWAHEAYLKAHNARVGDRFGGAVAISGGLLAVGAVGQAGELGGVSTLPNGWSAREIASSAPDAGAAYVFGHGASGWTELAFLKASDATAGDRFGSSIALAGEYLAVGAPAEDSVVSEFVQLDDGRQVLVSEEFDASADAGAVYTYTRDRSGWFEEARLKGANTGAGDRFGSALALEAGTLIVGAPGEDGSTSGSTLEAWSDSDDSTSDAGAAYVFEHSGGHWHQHAYLKANRPEASTGFGWSVATVSNMVAVGFGSTSGPELAHTFTHVGNTWTSWEALTVPDGYGTALGQGHVELGPNALAVGMPLADVSSRSEDGVVTDGGSTDVGLVLVYE